MNHINNSVAFYAKVFTQLRHLMVILPCMNILPSFLRFLPVRPFFTPARYFFFGSLFWFSLQQPCLLFDLTCFYRSEHCLYATLLLTHTHTEFLNVITWTNPLNFNFLVFCAVFVSLLHMWSCNGSNVISAACVLHLGWYICAFPENVNIPVSFASSPWKIIQ